MRKIQLSSGEYPIKIDSGVLDDFEEQSGGVGAYEFNQKVRKQLKLMTYLALKNANKDFKMTLEEVGKEVNFVTMAPLVEEFFIAALGPEGEKIAEEQVKGKK